MANTERYRLTRKKIIRSETVTGTDIREVIEKGDVFVPTDAELKFFGDRLVKVENNAGSGDTLSLSERISLMSARKVVELVGELDLDPAEVIKLEQAGRNRKSVVQPLEKMLSGV